jgi:hypothetical protein
VPKYGHLDTHGDTPPRGGAAKVRSQPQILTMWSRSGGLSTPWVPTQDAQNDVNDINIVDAIYGQLVLNRRACKSPYLSGFSGSVHGLRSRSSGGQPSSCRRADTVATSSSHDDYVKLYTAAQDVVLHGSRRHMSATTSSCDCCVSRHSMPRVQCVVHLCTVVYRHTHASKKL